MVIAAPQIGPIPDPFLYNGFILPAFHLIEQDVPFGGHPDFDYPRPRLGSGSVPSQPWKDAGENSRIRFRHLRNENGRGSVGNHQPVYAFKDATDGHRIKLRKYPCEPFTPIPTDRVWETGQLWKERPLLSSDVLTGASATVFTASFTAESLGWVDSNGTPPYVIPGDHFADYWIRWRTGANANLLAQITSSADTELTLVSAMPATIEAGDTFDILRQPEPRVRGRHYQKRRVLGVQNYPIRAGGRSNVIVPHTFKIEITNFQPVTNPLAQPHNQYDWFGFRNWSDVLSESPSMWSSTTVQRSYIADVLIGARFFVSANGILTGAVRDGYSKWSGTFGVNGNSLHPDFGPSSTRILLGENTVFNDSPGIPLPIRFYLEGVYVRTRELTSFFSTDGGIAGGEVAVKPWWGMQWIFNAYDGAGHRLFDREFAPYSDWIDGDWGIGPFLPRFPVNINWWGLVTASPAISWFPRLIPYVIGPMGHSNAGIGPFQASHTFADDMYEPPYLSECDAALGGTIKYDSDADGRAWVPDGVDTRYNVVTDVSF